MPRPDPALVERMEAVEWRWADKDQEAFSVLRDRIAHAGKVRGFKTYSELADGVIFKHPNLNRGRPYQIDTTDWGGLDRALLGEFLGLISSDSYSSDGFMASALVVGKTESRPSDHFFEWMRELEVLPDTKEDTVLRFWAEQVTLAHAYYQKQDQH